MCRAGFSWLCVGGRGVFLSLCVPAHQYSSMAIVRDGGGGGTSGAIGTKGFRGRLVRPASPIFYCACCGGIGIPPVRLVWGLWGVFVELCRGSGAEVVMDEGLCCVMCGVEVQRMAVHRLSRCTWGAYAYYC